MICGVVLVDCFFFFSSRRRHTRLVSDWSSDVCSSDLPAHPYRPQPRGVCRGRPARGVLDRGTPRARGHVCLYGRAGRRASVGKEGQMTTRSEERRVGKECRSRWSTYHEKKKRRRRWKG